MSPLWAPYPAKEKWDECGFEYKSEATLFGLPLLHISFKYRPNRIALSCQRCNRDLKAF